MTALTCPRAGCRSQTPCVPPLPPDGCPLGDLLIAEEAERVRRAGALQRALGAVGSAEE